MAETARRKGIRDERVLAALEDVERHRFVPLALRPAAYKDRALPIGRDQTISQPSLVARMAEALHLSGQERVLEVGTGSGYGAAILGRLAAEVHSVERHPELADRAAAALRETGAGNVHVHTGDGRLGWPEGAPYDGAVVTAAAREVPVAVREQVRDGGRIVAPLGPVGPQGQRLTLLCRRGPRWSSQDLGGVAFVPLERGVPE